MHTSMRLDKNKAITLDDLHTEPHAVFDVRARVRHMKKIVNWAGLCEAEKCLQYIREVPKFQKYWFKSSAVFRPVTPGTVEKTLFSAVRLKIRMGKISKGKRGFFPQI